MEDERLLYNIAVSYYVNKMTQQEIADAKQYIPYQGLSAHHRGAGAGHH